MRAPPTSNVCCGGRSFLFVLWLLAAPLSALVVLTAASTASAQDPATRSSDGDLDLMEGLYASLYMSSITMGTVTLIGGLVAEARHGGRQLWFVANLILGGINVALATVALTFALEEQPHKDAEGSHYTMFLNYAAILGAVGVIDIALAVILRLDMDDERWPRPLVLRDVNNDMAPGLGLRGTF